MPAGNVRITNRGFLQLLAILVILRIGWDLEWRVWYLLSDNQRDPTISSSNSNSLVNKADDGKSHATNNDTEWRPIIDIISIGSLERPEYQDAQQQTFGTHPSVRHFFKITEQDDVDQGDKNCNDHISWREVQNISGFCGGLRRQVQEKHPFLYHLRIKFAKVQWLERKSNPVAWLCAQKRPMAGFQKTLQFYRQTSEQQEEGLPDFLTIIDDDTYFNMNRVVDYLVSFQAEKIRESQDDNLVIAGCVIRGRIKGGYKWTFPFGGWGTIFNRGSLQTILQPLYCTQKASNSDIPLDNEGNDRTNDICNKLRKDRIGEYQVYHEGMSLSDVLHAYVMREPYTDQANWSLGFCLHSDWVWGCKLFQPIFFRLDFAFTLVANKVSNRLLFRSL